MKDLYHNVSVTHLLDPQVATTAKTSAGLDLQGFASANVLFVIGAAGDTLSGGIYWTLKLQESDDNSSYSDVLASDLLNGSATVVINSLSLDQATYSFGYIGSKRYLKGVATPTGTHTNGTPLGIVGLRGAASYNPVV